MLACTALVGCTSDDVIDNVTPDKDGLKNFVTKINLNLPKISNESRGYNPSSPTYNDGVANEYAVNSVTVKFYDVLKNHLGDATEITWTDDLDNDNVSRYGYVSFRSVTQPYYAVVFVNAPEASASDLQNKSIAEMKEIFFNQTTYPISTTAGSITSNEVTTGNFFMTNSSHRNTAKDIVQEVNISEATAEVKENMTLENALKEISEDKIAEIYVERVVAKVELGVNLTTTNNKAVDGNPGLYQLKYITTGEETDGSNKEWSPYAIKVTDWMLNGTNKTFYPLKKIVANWEDNWYNTGRSFWAIDSNYENGDYCTDVTTALLDDDDLSSYDLNYYKLSQIEGDVSTNTVSNPQYCYENTYDPAKVTTNSAATHVVLKAQYYKQNGTTWAPVNASEYIYRINQVIFNEANMKERIAAALIDKYDYYASGSTVKMSEKELVNAITLTVDDKTAVTTIGLVEGTTVKNKNLETERTSTDSWNLEFNGGTIVGYKGGFCYYTIPIKHFATGAEGEKVSDLGHYGVVRNHWYVLDVTSIAGFGDPGTENPIIPEEEEELKDWVVKCKININAWAKVTQGNITVGGGNSAWD